MELLQRTQCLAKLPDANIEMPSLLIHAKGVWLNVGEHTIRHENPVRTQNNNNGSMENHKLPLIGIYH